MTGVELHYQELNLIQVLDVLREGGVAHLALAGKGRPYVVPVMFQLEMRGTEPVLHLASPAEGRKMSVLQANDRVCLEIMRPACAWIDTVLAEGRGMIRSCEGGAEVLVLPETITGRRFFRPA